MLSKNIIFTGLLVLGLSVPLVAQGQRDVIRLKTESKPRETAIVEENYKGVRYSVGRGGTSLYLWKEIDSIEYRGRPKELSRAISLVKKGDYEKGLKRLQKYADQKSLKKVYRQHALFYLAQALESLTPPQIDRAIATYRQLLDQFEKSRYLTKANERIVACLIAGKKFGEAHKALDSAREAAVSRRLEDRIIRDLDLVECALLENEGKFVKATNCYEKLKASAASNPEVSDLAGVGAARSLVRNGGDPLRARAVFEAGLRQNDRSISPIVMAAAWNGLGEVLLAEGRKGKNADKVQEALYCFLRGVIQYFPGENDRTSEYERSLFYSGHAFRSLADLLEDKVGKKIHRLRANEKFQELKALYPLSPFTAQLK